jgi:NADPH2:quinone reductase
MPAEKRAALFGELLAGIASGALTLPVAGTFDLADISAAVAACAAPARGGKVLLRP